MKDHKEGKPDNNQKRLLGLYKLPNKSDWNEGMTEDEKGVHRFNDQGYGWEARGRSK